MPSAPWPIGVADDDTLPHISVTIEPLVRLLWPPYYIFRSWIYPPGEESDSAAMDIIVAAANAEEEKQNLLEFQHPECMEKLFRAFRYGFR